MVYTYDKKLATILVLPDSVTRTHMIKVTDTSSDSTSLFSDVDVAQSISKVQTSVSRMWILEGVAALLACTDDETAHELIHRAGSES